jgi:hypothetical protein
MSTKHLPLLILTALLISPIASCGSKPKATKVEATASPSPAISITKPINKAKDTQTNVEQLGKQREQLNPDAPAPAKP